MLMDFDISYLEMLARPDTSTPEITALATSVMTLIDGQLTMLEILQTMLGGSDDD